MATIALVRGSVQEVLGAQLEDNQPPEARQTLARLEGLGYSRDAARNLIGCVLALEMREAKGPPAADGDRYLANLRRLPKLPGE
jgi:hypothetical protein